MDKRKRTQTVLLSTLLVTALSVYALWLMCIEYRSYRQQTLGSQDAQLFSVSHAVDRSLDIALEQYCRNLTYVIARPGFTQAEQVYLETGDPAELKAQMSGSLLLQDPTVRTFLARGEPGARISAGTGVFDFPQPTSFSRGGVRIGLSRTETGAFGLAFTAPGPDGRLDYTLVLDLPALYRLIAGTQSYDSLLLLDRENQVLLRTTTCGEIRVIDVRGPGVPDEQDQAFLTQMDAAAIETAGSRETAVFFDAPSCAGAPGYTARLAAFSPDALDNGYFSIGVSMNYDDISAGLRRNTLRISLYAAIVVAAFLHLLGKTLRMARMGREAELEAEALRARNDALAEMGRRQQDLAHNQRLQTIGTLTSGVAHEFNNLLTPILGYSMLALESLPDDQSELYDDLLEIYDAACKSKQIVARISLLSGKHMDLTFKPLNLDRLTESVASVLRPTTPPNVRLVTTLACGPCRVDGNETHLSQVILNLCINALHAMEPDGGVLTLETALVRGESGRWAELRVSDTGAGIEPALMEHLFEPFFTTKPAGKGSGLGLPLARQILDEHKGTIHLESQPGRGTTAIVRLPFAPAAPFAPDPSPSCPNPPAASEQEK